MSYVIWKKELPILDNFMFEAPEDLEVMFVREQHGVPYLWFRCDQSKPFSTYTCKMYGTGVPFPDQHGEYLGSAFIGAFVWHYFLMSEQRKEMKH